MTEKEALEYVNSVSWAFAKTYLTAPHEYTVTAWKPELHKKMLDFARYIREHGQIIYFYKTPFVKLFLDGYQYWTMDKKIEDTTLINRTFIDESRCNIIRQYTTSPAYIHEHHESLLDVEKRAKLWLNLL